MKIKTFYARNLPHLLPIGASLFVTPRLAGSIPLHLIDQWKREKKEAIQKIKDQFKPQKGFTGAANSQLGEQRKSLITNIQKRYFAKVDDYLDKAAFGPTWLKDTKAAEELAKKIHQYDGEYYDLIAFTIMSNHFHLLIDTSSQLTDIPDNVEITTENYAPLEKIMHQIKGGSAFEINKVIGRKGRFWQPESYDHFTRTVEEFFNIIRYIANNPVKAGLVRQWNDFPFTYVKSDFLDALG